MPASSSPGFAGTPPMSDQSVLAMARRRGGAGSPTRLRAPEPRPSCPARHVSGGSPRWGSPWPTAVPTAPSPRTGLASPVRGDGAVGTAVGQGEPHLGLPPDTWRAGHDGRGSGALKRVGDPAPPRRRAIAKTLWSDIGGVPANPGDDDAGM